MTWHVFYRCELGQIRNTELELLIVHMQSQQHEQKHIKTITVHKSPVFKTKRKDATKHVLT